MWGKEGNLLNQQIWRKLKIMMTAGFLCVTSSLGVPVKHFFCFCKLATGGSDTFLPPTKIVWSVFFSSWEKSSPGLIWYYTRTHREKIIILWLWGNLTHFFFLLHTQPAIIITIKNVWYACTWQVFPQKGSFLQGFSIMTDLGYHILLKIPVMRNEWDRYC